MISEAGKRIHTCPVCKHYGDDAICPHTMCLPCLFKNIEPMGCISVEDCRMGVIGKFNACEVFELRQWDA
jgi:hypothetical protein